ncbi:MAG: hypothetical protein ABI867_38465 [Kofleriaceae bacterium]
MNDPLLLRILDEAEARQLPALAAEWILADDHRHWIARALRIDLALLVARPELVVPCLYRRCATVGWYPLEAHFFTQRLDLAWEPHALHAWVTAAAEAWGAGRSWLRTLRTPAVPLDGAVIEEYRTAIRGRLWCSHDGTELGVTGETSIAWERATGRRVEPRPPIAAPSSDWEEARSSSWGMLVLERDGDRVMIGLPDDQIVRRVHAVSRRHVLVIGDDIDQDTFHAVVDTRTGQLAWRARGSCSAVVPIDDDHALFVRDGTLARVHVASGSTIESWFCPHAGETVVLADGNFAVRTGDLIRVWDHLAAKQPQAIVDTTRSFLEAAVSPDGTRVLAGQLLCDARKGEVLARLPLDGPGYLEGGPPQRCQRLCDGVVAEIQPWGFNVWDSETGAQLVRDPDRSGRISDLVAFDSAGRWGALWRRGSLTVFTLRGNTTVHDLTLARPDDFTTQLAFSGDGEQLVWQVSDGARWVLAVTAGATPRQLADTEPDPRVPEPADIPVTDGLLVLGAAAIPCDDATAVVSRDGRVVVTRHSHYWLEQPR